MNCTSCNTEIKSASFFCPQCGKLAKRELFKKEELVKEYENKIMNIINKISMTDHDTILWDAVIDRYAETLEKLKSLLSEPEFETNKSNFINRMNSFVNRCKKPDFHIAFVGTIKAGKSTLINALLGKNYASTSVTPETAVLTKFRHCSSGNYIHIKFYTKEEWGKLWSSIAGNADIFTSEYKKLGGDNEKAKWIGHDDIHIQPDTLEEEIERWTSSKKVEHYFVKEVEIGLLDFQMPEEVVFVDTPGLDDAVKYRSDVTREYIDRANAVFTCVRSDALTGSELNTLYRIFSNTSYNPEKVYVVGTQWDTLNNPVADWSKQKEEWVKYLSRKDAYGSEELARRNIEHAAAYINNLARDYQTLDEDKKYTMQSIGFKFKIYPNELEANLEKLVEVSNIDKIGSRIKNDIVVKYKEYLYRDIEQTYLDIKRDIKNYFNEIRSTQEEILDTSKKNIKEIRQDYEKAKKEIEDVKIYGEQLNNMLKIVKEDTDKKIKELTKQLSSMAG